MKVVWSPLALEKLVTMAKFIAFDKPSAADKWVNDIFDRTDLLGTQPELGREVPELLGSRYRELIFGSYRIIYKVEHEIKIFTLRNRRQLLSLSDVEQ
ncbi:type II toxin-antitoxin system RelE/ParE family toxin [Pseudoalteromonas nigrifaciens]|uniref:type II toxin-antitoxin system RelE/ParE family toxin n=1 Tax=Pseudoalteromonas nigrifaciens TaxID=28109 RepID=UPI003569E850